MKSNLKKIFILSIFIIALLFNNLHIVYAEDTNKPELVSRAAILIDNKTNKILYDKN